ncbi:putative Lysyl-tRNA synthetase [Dimargaris cristalligena]|uniref:Lysine--tRNA ligase n=1 Tax=Dimargaris cristalligena TaxID=215637 RepID=A0A4P9ZQ91_9FUNG|nr:putative Lysyl-tRNA synthetase [Dimargaris cristalligena]|eukprot:RKP34540.1 putative Lysyl-tRNA synthetase [Dimargaris cristalligena]
MVNGRVISRREASSKLIFIELLENNQHLQLVLSKATVDMSRGPLEPTGSPEFGRHHKLFRKGDIIQARGYVGKTKTGELSLFVTQPLRLLSPCLHDLPFRTGLRNYDRRYRQRYLDMLLNPDTRQLLRQRALLIRTLRQYFDQRGFTEVETPILWPQAGGANARPFRTEAHALSDLPLQLRVAPELFLKRLVIGGLDRVFEIGKQFRNEGIDADHNPEFTTIEFYQAYTNMEGLIKTTEELLREIAVAVTGSAQVTYSAAGTEPVLLDFKPPFKRIHVMEELERKLGESLPNLDDPDFALAALTQICQRHRIRLCSPVTLPRVLDTLIGHYLEPNCIQPTFLYGHPKIMSPLAKSNDKDTSVTQRFELFMLGKEIVNAYEELNDPEDQRARFAQQLKDRAVGDEEAHNLDEGFCQSLEYGLPPTGGWGMGIDRLCAILTNVKHLRETLTFPIMRPSE